MPGAKEPLGPPPVDELLDVDREYRAKAARGELRVVAPHDNNPSREAWLPILNTRWGERRYTALYSNTDRAHDLEKTDDWVVIYQDSPEPGGRWTIVTETGGPLEGKRVVRGREAECRVHYRAEGGQGGGS